MAKDRTVKTVPRHRRRKTKHRVLLTLISLIIMLGLICCLLVGGYVMAVAADLPDITAEDLVTAQTSFVYDSQGNEIATLHGGENRITVPLDQMPKHLLDAASSGTCGGWRHADSEWNSRQRRRRCDTQQ